MSFLANLRLSSRRVSDSYYPIKKQRERSGINRTLSRQHSTMRILHVAKQLRESRAQSRLGDGFRDQLVLVPPTEVIFPIADPAHITVSESQDDTKDQPATSDAPSDLPDFPLPPATDNSHTDSPDPPDPELNRLSDISSDFDSADRSSGQNQDSGEEGEDASAQPHLMVVHVTQEGAQEKHSVHDDVSYATCVTPGHSSYQEDSVTSQSSCVTCATETDLDNVLGVDKLSLEKADERSISPSSAQGTLTPDNSLCMDSVSLSTSTLMEDDFSTDDVTLSPEESYHADYMPDIYSNTPVNISDATFSDASVERSHRSKSRLGKMSALGSSSSIKAGSDTQTDSEAGTPPVSLDSEGAEELSDAASWPRSPSRRTMSDLEIVNHEDAPPLDGSFSSTSSGSSLSRSPGSTKQGLRLLADSWADYSPPGQGYVQFVAVSDTHIWCVTTYDDIFYCPTHFSVVTWTQLRGSARMIAVNNTGDVIWNIDRKNYAHARTGVNDNHLTGKKWQPVEKDMRYVAVEGTAVWGVKVSPCQMLERTLGRYFSSRWLNIGVKNLGKGSSCAVVGATIY